MILRFEDAEDIHDIEVDKTVIETLRQMEKTFGYPLDLYRQDPVLFDRLVVLPKIPVKKNRRPDFWLLVP